MPVYEVTIPNVKILVDASGPTLAEHAAMDFMDDVGTQETLDEILPPSTNIVGVGYTMSARLKAKLHDPKLACPKCGKMVRRSKSFEDSGEGEEAGRTFYYCSSHCRETH